MELSIQERLKDLRLSDDMIELLRSGRIDTALLCELAAHPDFVKLLADIQIYVQGIAATQIQNLNAWVDVARAETMEKHQPGGTTADGVLQADEAALQQADQGRKTMADTDCSRIRIGEKLHPAEVFEMDLFQNWKNQLDVLHRTYCKICEPEKVEYKKDICATQNEIDELERKLLIPIPKSLKDTFLFFSKNIDFYAYLPDEFELPQELREIFSASFEVSMKEMILAEQSRKSWVEGCFSNQNDDYDKVWHNKLGFMTVPNGDIIAFDLSDPKDDKKVVYLSHDDGEGHGVVLGENFEEYFSNLLLIGGCGNEDWQMIPFIDKAKGLCANSENADTYRKLIGLTW